MTKLPRQRLAELQQIWHDLQREPDVGQAPETVDAVSRSALDGWLAGVIASKGRIDAEVLDDLLDQAHEAKGDPMALKYIERAIAVNMPDGNQLLRWWVEADDTIREHCRRHGYQISEASAHHCECRKWKIIVPGRAGGVELELHGEVCLLTFSDEFTWPEFGYTPEEVREVVADQLRLLDAYASPGTRMVLRKRALRRSRSELHLSDGTVLWRHGGKQVWL